MVKGQTTKGKATLMPNQNLQVTKGDVYHCGSALKIYGKLDLAASDFVRFFCMLCDKAFDTINEHEVHNKKMHKHDQICSLCLHPTTRPDMHDLEYSNAALLRLKEEGMLVEDGPRAEADE